MTERRDQLRDFLMTRRERLRPEDVGLPAGPGRRVPGLRREEIALLAGVSVDYYVRLEQGRNGNVSSSVLDAVARALQLDEAERRHLFDLARPASAHRRRPVQRQRVRASVLGLLAGLELQPAFVVGDRMDVLAANPLAEMFFGESLTVTHDRNLARFILLDDAARDLHADWERVAEDAVALLRLYAGRHADDPELSRLIGDLTLGSAEFGRLWSAHDVRSRAFGTKRYRHPAIGEITLAYEALDFPGDEGQRLCISSAEPGSAAEDALRLLATLAADTPGEGRLPGPRVGLVDPGMTGPGVERGLGRR